MQSNDLKRKLFKLKKQYPHKDWRVLQTEALNFTISLTARGAAKTFSIDGSLYKGIIYVNVIHDLSKGLSPKALTLILIVDKDEFLQSGNYALMLLKKCEI